MFSCLFVARVSRTICSIVCWLLRDSRAHCLFSCLLRESLANCLFSCLFICCARVAHCLFESRNVSSLVFVCYARVGCNVCYLVCCLLRASRAQCLFSCLFVCYTRVARNVCSLICLKRKSLLHCSLVRLFVTRVLRCLFSDMFFVCYARILRTVCSLDCLLLNLVHCLFSGLFVCYPRVSCTVCSMDCLFVTQESCALFVLWIVCYSRVLSTVCSLDCLLPKSLVHCLFSGLFVTQES